MPSGYWSPEDAEGWLEKAGVWMGIELIEALWCFMEVVFKAFVDDISTREACSLQFIVLYKVS
jgi:hypothetical protein